MLFKFMGEEESMEEPAWLALRSNSASVETGGGGSQRFKSQLPYTASSQSQEEVAAKGKSRRLLLLAELPRHPNLHPYSF